MRKNQKAGQAGSRKNRSMPGYNHGNIVGYPKTGLVKMRNCPHRLSINGSGNQLRERSDEFAGLAKDYPLFLLYEEKIRYDSIFITVFINNSSVNFCY
jgi:hypothetical protein